MRCARIPALRRGCRGGAGFSVKVIERSAIVTHTAGQMFALVDDVARYPQFLPWCRDARIESVSARERLAALQIAKGSLHMEFTTRNTVEPDALITMELVKGPFNRLTGRWSFTSLGERGSRVVFRVEFEFKNRLMRIALDPLFESICDKIVDAFVKRAQDVYRGASQP